MNINDNTPSFASKQVRVSISEGSKPQSRYQLSPAVDLDDPNEPLTYSILCAPDQERGREEGKKADDVYDKGGDDDGDEDDDNDGDNDVDDDGDNGGDNGGGDDDEDGSYFGLESIDGDLYLMQSRRLDRESRDKFECQVEAVDSGGKKGRMTLWVDVDDVNDNAPVFDMEAYSAGVSERIGRGEVLLRVHASDSDKAQNAEVHYRMSESSQVLHGHMFSVDANTGDVILTSELDRETLESHQFIVEAFDSGTTLQNSAFVRVSIEVSDENDNDPVITVTSFGNEEDSLGTSGVVSYFDITENAEADKFVAFLSVNDEDAGKNAECICGLKHVKRHRDKKDTSKEKKEVSYLGHFKLSSYYEDGYKLETARPLDREKVPFYEVVVHCTDQGTPQRTSTTSIYVRVNDVNDNRPLFMEKQIRIEVEEGNEIGKLLATLKAHDLDTSENANTFYALQPMVNSSQGMKDLLDRRNNYGSKGLFSHNDDILPDYEEGERMSFNVMNLAQLDERNGHLFALVSFDYETMPSELNYKAIAYESLNDDEKEEDDGEIENWSWIPVSVSIVDTNDEKPVFTESHYSFQTFENAHFHENILGQVKATDADITPAFKEIFYELLPSTTSHVFQIDEQSGILSTNARFNREERERYNLVVKAYNPVATIDNSPSKANVFSLVNVTIRILDENDNTPVFKFPSQPSSKATISTSHAVGEVVCTVEATDEDGPGENSKISYSIIKSEQLGEQSAMNDESRNNGAVAKDAFEKAHVQSRMFEVNETTGEIVTLKALEEEGLYQVLVLAEDHGTPSLSKVAVLLINVNNSKGSLALVQDVVLEENEGWHGMDQKYLLPLLLTVCCVIASILCLVCIIATAVMCKRMRKRKRDKEDLENSVAMTNSCYTDKRFIQGSLLTGSSCGIGSRYEGLKITDNWTGNDEGVDTWKELSVHSIESKQSCCSTYNCIEHHCNTLSPTSNELAVKSNATTPLTATSFCQYDKGNKACYRSNTGCNSRCCCYNSCNSIRSCANDGKCTKCGTANNAVENKSKNYESDNHDSLVHKKVNLFPFELATFSALCK